ncbi:hypothetical protein V2G26_000130 [Clonostachys chloroleuca]
MAPLGTSTIAWLRERRPFKSPPPPMPYLPAERPRPLTPSSPVRTGANESPLFNQLPYDVLQAILRSAFADYVLHIELDYDHPMIPLKNPANRHGARNGGRYWQQSEKPPHTQSDYFVRVEKWRSKRWQWWSCVCHRSHAPFASIRGTHWAGWCSGDDAWYDACKFGVCDYCEIIPGVCPQKCHIEIMGWLLSCHQAYCLGIKILYSMNTFHLSNPELILNLPRLLLPSRLAAITSLEMLWKIHPFREEDDHDPPYSGYETFLALAQKIPIHFKGLRNLYISLQGDLCMGNGSGDIDYTGDSKQKFDLVEDRLITPVEAMIRNLSCIETCVIALPSSCYGPEKCVAMESGSLIFERRSIDGQQEKRREELWRELGECSSPGFHGYWIQLGHRDLRILEMGCGIGSAPVPKDHPLNVLYELCRSPW